VRIDVRKACAGEEDALGERGFTAFRQGEPEGWKRYYRENPHGGAKETLVAEVDGVPGGQATALTLTLRLSGEDVPVRGIAAVGVAPEHRHVGLAALLVAAWLRRMRRRGEALAALYPFHVSFYRKFGFGRCEWVELCAIEPRELPASPLRRRVRRLDRERDRAGLARAYEAWRAPRTGPLARSDWWWTARVLERAPEGVVYEEGGQIRGYALYEVPIEGAVPGRQRFTVRELVAATPDAFRGLVGFLEAQGEQFESIEMALGRGEGLALRTGAGRASTSRAFRFHQVEAEVAGGAMARVVDLAGALRLHPAAGRVRSRIGLDLTDPVFGARSYDVRGATAAPGREARQRLSLSVDRLSQIYFGAASARLFREQGLIEGSERAAAVLDDMFAGPAPFFSPLNAF
jgi:predicted acetyltransferase